MTYYNKKIYVFHLCITRCSYHDGYTFSLLQHDADEIIALYHEKDFQSLSQIPFEHEHKISRPLQLDIAHGKKAKVFYVLMKYWDTERYQATGISDIVMVTGTEYDENKDYLVIMMKGTKE